MIVRLAGVVVLVGWGACDVAEAPPLRQDMRDASSAETREDTRVHETQAETEVTSPADTSPEIGDDTSPEDTSPEDTSPADTTPEDTSPEDTSPEDTSPEDTTPEDTSPEDTSPEDTSPADTSPDAPACATTVVLTAPVSSPHIPTCSEVTYATNPPTSGPHYPIWTQWKTYTAPVPRGFYVHNLEHGGVVVAYRCPDGCTADVAAIEAMVTALPADPLCSFGISRRLVVTPDPLLATRFAVTAWGASLVADCFDAASFAAFIGDHYATGPENTCADGVDVTVPDLGTYCPPE